MVRRWRAAFRQPALPFLFAQLDGFAAPGSNFAAIRMAQAQAERDLSGDTDGVGSRTVAMAQNYDLGTLNDAGGKIHSPRKQELGRRLALLARSVVYSEAVVAPQGAVLSSATAAPAPGGGDDTLVTLRFARGGAGGAAGGAPAYIALHGTAGCVGGNDTSAVPRPRPFVGFRCCDTSPFFVKRLGSDWQRHEANATTVNHTGGYVVLHVRGGAAGRSSGGALTGVRYAWEGYPNCALYNAGGGPAAGAWNVRGGMAPGCAGYADCVYAGDALPTPPFEITLGVHSLQQWKWKWKWKQ